MDLSIDQFLGGAIDVYQPVEGYRAATDPVFLAASLALKSGDQVLDVGCGVGTASLCLAARVQDVTITGLDIQSELIEIAQKNARQNGFEERLNFYAGNLLERALKEFTNSFDHVMANPPFYERGSGQRPPNTIKARANMEEDASLTDWIDFMFKMAKPRATITMINRMERLDETLSAFMGRIGDIIVYPLWSASPDEPDGQDKARKGAKRFLIQGRKSLKSPMRLSCGLVIHEQDGSYRPKARAVLMAPCFLDLGK